MLNNFKECKQHLNELGPFSSTVQFSYGNVNMALYIKLPEN